MQQLKKTHANRRNTRKIRKHLHQFDNTCAAFRKCSANTETLLMQKCCKYRKRQRKCYWRTLKVLNKAWTLLLPLFVTHEVAECYAQSRAVAEVRNPQCKHEEMMHGPDFNNRRNKLVQTMFSTFNVLCVPFCICSVSVSAAHFLNAARVVKLMKMLSDLTCFLSCVYDLRSGEKSFHQHNLSKFCNFLSSVKQMEKKFWQVKKTVCLLL